MSIDRPIILIVGPTAGGKTPLAIGLAMKLPGGGECICADSMQVYRGMDIGTAKPTAQEQAQAVHHLIDVADPSEDGFTVDTWLRACRQAIDDVRGRGRWPIVVGGTNLYVQALLEGLFEGPDPDPQLRARLQQEPEDSRRRRLEAVDPDAAARIHRNDHKRTIRALEVYELTGRPISAWQQQWQQAPPRNDVILIGLDDPVQTINRRINARVKAMVEAGLVQEVRRLHGAGSLGVQAREALGYRQVIDAIEGRTTMDEAIEQIGIRSRRFAKQQRTWLRRFRRHPRSAWLSADEDDQQCLVDTALMEVTRLVEIGSGGGPQASRSAPGIPERA